MKKKLYMHVTKVDNALKQAQSIVEENVKRQNANDASSLMETKKASCNCLFQCCACEL